MALKIRTALPDPKSPEAKYYKLRRGEGGWNPCIDVWKEKDAKKALLDPNWHGACNCVWVVNGLFNEIAGTTQETWLLGSWNAKDFYKNAQKQGLKVGQKPKVGAVAVWGAKGSNKYGHCAVVTGVEKDGRITTAEGAYNSYLWKNKVRTNLNGRWGQGSNYPFLGFIYNPNIPEDLIEVGSKVRVKKGAKNYSGKNLSSWVYDYTFTVKEVKGDRIVIGKLKNGKVSTTAAMHLEDLIKQ